jgi:hypothetical protein
MTHVAATRDFRHSFNMAKCKTTVYIDEDLLRAARVAAARSGKKDYEILEAALRGYLGMETLETVRVRADLTDDEALALAYRELHDR